MSSNPKACQSRPSYEEGKTRDPKVAAMQREGIERDKFFGLIRKAVKKPSGRPAEQPEAR